MRFGTFFRDKIVDSYHVTECASVFSDILPKGASELVICSITG